MLERLKSKEIREKIEKEMVDNIMRGDEVVFDRLMITSCPSNRDMRGNIWRKL